MLKRNATIMTALLFAVSLYAVDVTQAAEPAGHVLAASGEVHAESAEGRRTLKRRSEFFAGDTLVTAAGASAQLRFQDGALVALQPDTRFRVDAYRFDTAAPAQGEAVSTLIKGGFRTITGVIGKQDPAAYRVETPVATIGVRGTNYEAVLADGLVVAAWQGQIVVSNEQGALVLGEGANFNFAQIGNRTVAPRGQLAPPPGLQGELPAPPPEARAAPRPPVGPVPDATQPKPAPLAGVLPPPGMPAPLPSYNSSGDDLAVGGFTPLSPVNTPADLPVANMNDLRLTAAEKADLNYLGFALVSGPGIMNTLGGKTTNGSAGSPVIAEVGVNPGQPGFNSLPFTKIVRQGAAPLFGATVNTVMIDGTHKIDWGVWNASPSNPAHVQTNPTNPSQITPITRPVFWLSGNPTSLAVATARTGTVTYGGIASWPTYNIAVQGGGSGGMVDASNFSFQADVNFSTGAVTGNVQITPSVETWNIGFTGTMANGFLSVPPGNYTGSVNDGVGTYGVDGDIGASLTGGSGQALTGSFDFEAVGNPNVHTEGIFIVGECPSAC